MKKWTHIILHHSKTKDSGTVSWGAIRKYHMNKGWRDIGYHWGLEKINDTYEILVGRPLDISGAHTKGMNSKAIGICCVGDYDEVYPDDEMIKKLVCLCKGLVEMFKIPKENVTGHRYFADKSCPGIKFDLEKVRNAL